jgi:predicted ATP-grasp superfamily ATP-dependent carboligase
VAEIGCEVLVVDIGNYKTSNPAKPLDCYSKYVDYVFFFNRKLGREGLVQFLLQNCADKDQKPIIIPTSDFSAIAIDNEIVKKHFLVPFIGNDQNSIVYWMNKANQKEAAIKAGLNVAGSCIIKRDENAFIVPNEVRYPCFTKPLSSIGGGKRCLKKCNSKDELLVLLNFAEKNDIKEILVEDYLDIEEEFAVLGFSDGKEVVIPGIIKFIKGCQSHKGVAMVGEVLPVDGFSELIEKFANFIRYIGFVGLFDIDFFKCQGACFFGELNLRIGASGTAITKMGVNLPAMYVKSMIGEGIGDFKKEITSSAMYVNERMCMGDWLAGRLSTLELHRILKSGDIRFVEDEDDIRPQKEFVKMTWRNYFNFKRIAKRLIYIFK